MKLLLSFTGIALLGLGFICLIAAIDEPQDLKEQLRVAVEEERFEEAARLRDLMRNKNG